MQRFVRAAVLASVLAGLLAAQPTAQAASAPTITGPERVPYFGTVRLSGVTEAGADVTVYLRGYGHSSWAAVRHVKADSGGHFSATYTAFGTESYYARAEGLNSAVRTTRLVEASCHVTRAAFTHLPLPRLSANRQFPEFAAFMATGYGLWAGVNWNAGTAQVDIITWRSGQQPHVLAHYKYPAGIAYEPESPGSVDVVGVTKSGHVVAAVQDPHSSVFDRVVRYAGYVWTGGSARRLASKSWWLSVHPVGVTSDGHIVGWILGGSASDPHFRVVRWSVDGRHVESVAYTRNRIPSPAVDADGDIAYVSGGGETMLRYPSGRTVRLPGTDSSDTAPQPLRGGAGHSMYGLDRTAVVRWGVGTGSSPIQITPLAPHGPNAWVRAAGPRGDIVNGYDTADGVHVRTARGAYVALPALLSTDYGTGMGYAINKWGTVAFTSARDHRVHFLVCR